MTMDPVCGMELEEASAAAQVQHLGNRYYFCSESCKEAFVERPDDFVGGNQPGTQA